MEFGFNFNSLSIGDKSGYNAAGRRTSYTHSLPGPVDEVLFPPAGFEGPFNGLGPIINPTAVAGASTVVPNAVAISGSREVDADLFGFRLGPYAELPVTDKFSAAVSAGLMVAVVRDEVNWRETQRVSTATTAGYWTGSTSVSENSAGAAVGFYAGLDLAYRFTDNLSVIAGARLQSLGTYKHSLGAGRMELDLGTTASINLGVGWSF